MTAVATPPRVPDTPHDAECVLESLHDRLHAMALEVRWCGSACYVASFERAFGLIDDSLVTAAALHDDKATPEPERDALFALKVELTALNDVLERLGAAQGRMQFLNPLYEGVPEGADTLQGWHSLMETLEADGYAVRALLAPGVGERVSELTRAFEVLTLDLGVLVGRHQDRVRRLFFCSPAEVLAVVAALRADEPLSALEGYYRQLYNFDTVYTQRAAQGQALLQAAGRGVQTPPPDLLCVAAPGGAEASDEGDGAGEGEDAEGGSDEGGGGLHITHVASDRGELLELLEAVPVGEAGAGATPAECFEAWMAGLEAAVADTVLHHIERAALTFEPEQVRLWAVGRPAVCVVLALDIHYTRRVEDAFAHHAQRLRGGAQLHPSTGDAGGGGDSPQLLRAEMDELLAEVVALADEFQMWVRSGNRTARVQHLLALTMHIRRVLEKLVADEVTSRHDMLWLKQCRWYLEPADARATAAAHRASAAKDECLYQTRAAAAGCTNVVPAAATGSLSGTQQQRAEADAVAAAAADHNSSSAAAPQAHPLRARVYCQQMHSTYEFHGEYSPVSRRPLLAVTDDVTATTAVVLQAFSTQYAGCLLYHTPKGPDPRHLPAFEPLDFVRDLSRRFGKMLHVVRCTAASTPAAVARVLLGAFASGQWVVFDRVDCLEPCAIDAITEGAAATRGARLSQATTYLFEGRVTPLTSRSFGVFAVLSGDTVGPGAQLALQKLRRALPPVAVPLVPLNVVLTQHFMLLGADDGGGMLGLYVASIFERAVFSSLRCTLRTLLKQFYAALARVNLKLRMSVEPVLAVVNALYKVTMRMSPEAEYGRLHSIMRACFGATHEVDVPGPADVVPFSPDVPQRLEAATECVGYNPSPLFLMRAQQFYEALLCGPAVVLHGPAASGKTSVWRTVHAACVPEATVDYVFPKLHDEDTFFGCRDARNAWVDGLFTRLIRESVGGVPQARQDSMRSTESEITPAASSADLESSRFVRRLESVELPALATENVEGCGDQRWIVVDGVPPPAILDVLLPLLDPEDRCLTLSSGEIIRAEVGLKILFEVDATEELPSALLESAAVVRTEAGTLSARDYIVRHANDAGFYLGAFRNTAVSVLSKLVPSIWEWALENKLCRADWDTDKDPKGHPTACFPLTCANLVEACFNVVNGFRNKRVAPRYTGAETRGLTEDVVEPILTFSCVWSFGVALAVGRPQMMAFNQFFRNLIIDKGLKTRFPVPIGGELGLVFDYVYDVDVRDWVRWSDLHDGDLLTPDVAAELLDCFVPRVTATRTMWLLRHLTDKGVNVLLCGPPGTGKTRILHTSLRHSTSIYCANATHEHVKLAVGSRLQKLQKNVIGVPDKLDKPMCLIMEDADVADETCFDLVKRLRDTQGWYDPCVREVLTVCDVAMAACADAAGMVRFSARQLQSFHFVCHTEPAPDEVLRMLDERIAAWLRASLAPPPPPQAAGAQKAPLRPTPPSQKLCAAQRAERADELAGFSLQVAECIIGMYDAVGERFRDSHAWGLSALQIVFHGMRMCALPAAVALPDILRLLINELHYTFGSGFEPRSKERRWVVQAAWDVVLRKFPRCTKASISCDRRGFWFGKTADRYSEHRTAEEWRDVVLDASHGLDDSLAARRPSRGSIAGRGSREALRLTPVLQERQRILRRSLETDVATRSVLANVTLLMRALSRAGSSAQRRSGGGGSGGNVILLAESVEACTDELALAAHLLEAQVFRPEAGMYYTEADWREDLKNVCLKAFVSAQPCVLLIDEQTASRGALADVSALVKYGDVPGLFTPHDWRCLTQTHRRTEAKSHAHVRDAVRWTLLCCLHFVVVHDPGSVSFGAALKEFTVLRSHFQVLSLERRDRPHLELVTAEHRHALQATLCVDFAAAVAAAAAESKAASADPAAPRRDSLHVAAAAAAAEDEFRHAGMHRTARVLSAASEKRVLFELCVALYHQARDTVRAAEKTEPHMRNVDTSALSLRRMLGLCERLVEEMNGATSRSEAHVQRCLDAAAATPAGEWPCSVRHWKRRLAELARVRTTHRGDATCLAAYNTWGVGLAAPEAFKKEMVDLFLTQGLQCTPHLDVEGVFDSVVAGVPGLGEDLQPHRGVVRGWVEAGVMRAVVPACIAIKYPTCKVVFAADPQGIGAESIRACFGPARLRVASPPFTDAMIHVVRSSMQDGKVLILNGVSQADLQQCWLGCVARDASRGTDPASTPNDPNGILGTADLHPDFRLVCLATGADAACVRLPPYVKVRCQCVSFAVSEGGEAGFVASAAETADAAPPRCPLRGRCNPAPPHASAASANAAQELREAEALLQAADPASCGTLLERAEASADELERASKGSPGRTSHKGSPLQLGGPQPPPLVRPTDLRSPFRRVGRAAAAMMSVAGAFRKVHPAACLPPRRLQEAMRRTLEELVGNGALDEYGRAATTAEVSDGQLVPRMLREMASSVGGADLSADVLRLCLVWLACVSTERRTAALYAGKGSAGRDEAGRLLAAQATVLRGLFHPDGDTAPAPSPSGVVLAVPAAAAADAQQRHARKRGLTALALSSAGDGSAPVARGLAALAATAKEGPLARLRVLGLTSYAPVGALCRTAGEGSPRSRQTGDTLDAACLECSQLGASITSLFSVRSSDGVSAVSRHADEASNVSSVPQQQRLLLDGAGDIGRVLVGLGPENLAAAGVTEEQAVERLRQQVEETEPLRPLLAVGCEDLFVARMKRVNTLAGVRRVLFVCSEHSQRALARALIEDAVTDGTWIVITGLTHSDEFAAELTDLVSLELPARPQPPHGGFKLIVHTEALGCVPPALAACCAARGIAGPRGLKERVAHAVATLRHYFTHPASSSRLSDPDKLELLCRYLPCVILLHALLMERQARGWVAGGYGHGALFTQDDLIRGKDAVLTLLAGGPAALVTQSVVRCAVVTLTYGARLAAGEDVAVLHRLADQVFTYDCDELATEPLAAQAGLSTAPPYKFSGDTLHNVRHDILTYAERMTSGDQDLQLLGISPVDTACFARVATLNVRLLLCFLRCAWTSTPSGKCGGAAGAALPATATQCTPTHTTLQFLELCRATQDVSPVMVAAHMCDRALDAVVDCLACVLPQTFDVAAAFEWLPPASNPVVELLYACMPRELERYNSVTHVMRRGLSRLSNFLAGTSVDEAACVPLATDLLSGRVPQAWLQVSLMHTSSRPVDAPYRTYREPPLHLWLESLVRGCEFFHEWSVEGVVPSVADARLFLEPSQLFYAELDKCAKENGIPASDMQIHLDSALPESADKPHVTEALHVKGLFVQGAVWCPERSRLQPQECVTVHCSLMPTVFLASHTSADDSSSDAGCTDDTTEAVPPFVAAPRVASHGDAKTCAMEVPLFADFSRATIITVTTVPASAELCGTDVAFATKPW